MVSAWLLPSRAVQADGLALGQPDQRGADRRQHRHLAGRDVGFRRNTSVTRLRSPSDSNSTTEPMRTTSRGTASSATDPRALQLRQQLVRRCPGTVSNAAFARLGQARVIGTAPPRSPAGDSTVWSCKCFSMDSPSAVSCETARSFSCW
jgi:hypothetical protein